MNDRAERETSLMPGAVWLGVAFVVLGLLHFIERDHTPTTRSYYIGGIHLRYRTRLHGPCYRCLADAVVDAEIAAREYQATSSEATEELRTPYLANDQLDLGSHHRL